MLNADWLLAEVALFTTSVAWKTTKNNAATLSLKTTWKPTFEWEQDTLF